MPAMNKAEYKARIERAKAEGAAMVVEAMKSAPKFGQDPAEEAERCARIRAQVAEDCELMAGESS